MWIATNIEELQFARQRCPGRIGLSSKVDAGICDELVKVLVCGQADAMAARSDKAQREG